MGRTACTELQCLYKGALYLFTYCYSDKERSRIPGEELILLLPNILILN